MNLADMTWKDVEGYLKKRSDIILPFGSVEEHGYHLPLSTDGDIALAVAMELSRRTGVITAPIVWYGVCNTTRDFPGTLTVDFDAFKEYAESLIADIERTGFQRICVISGHLGGSHVSAIKEASRKRGIELLFLDMRKVKSDDILETLPFHAGEGETSLMLHLYPDKVQMKKAVDEEIDFEEFSMIRSVKKTKSGVWGKPKKSSAKKGEKLFARIVETFEKAIK